MGIKVVITGVTGMVGEGVLHECLLDPRVESVLAISRKPTEMSHPKLREVYVKDFSNLGAIKAEFAGFDACYFCLGTTSIGKDEADYTKITYDIAVGFGQAFKDANPNSLFCFVSGAGTDPSLTNKQMWARVKGKTENDLTAIFGEKFYAIRPGYIQPTKGLKRTLKPYTYVAWLYPVFKLFFPSAVCTLREIGMAMISVSLSGYTKHILEVRDIINAANNS
ncbi:MAG: NAD-dependent epimerase/dehydratase family protein [bacterium]